MVLCVEISKKIQYNSREVFDIMSDNILLKTSHNDHRNNISSSRQFGFSSQIGSEDTVSFITAL